MEFHEKLQQLRKQHGLTQDELAEALFVSRTAISKWESGRGFPNIESLKAISKYFSVSLDVLLSSEEVLAIAENDRKENTKNFRDFIFGLLDCGILLLLFLPLFGQRADGSVQAVSLLRLNAIQAFIKSLYYLFVFGTLLLGILTLALQNVSATGWTQYKSKASLSFSILGVFLFIISRQPYAAAFIFAFFIIKVLLLLKHQ